MQLTISQIVELTKSLTIVPARDQNRIVKRVSWDTRALQPDTLFVALPGDHVDGNDYIIDAFEKGAAAVIASRDTTESERRAARNQKSALLYASNSLLALQRLAQSYRSLLSAKVVGITGSSGKTSTKMLVSAVLQKAFMTVSSIGNRNNEIGLPATVLSASPLTEVLVVEMAMRGIGQIEELCAIAKPQIGIITNIGPAHLELLGSKENIARAKSELICALPDERGIAILNGDDPYSSLIRELAQSSERGIRVVSFGFSKHNDIRADALSFDEKGHPSFELWASDGQPHLVHLNLQGQHSVMNALAAVAAGLSLGMNLQQIISALEQVQPAPMRQALHLLDDGTLLIDDTYNANPDSMRVALDVLSQQEKTRLHIAVLGGMLELGPSGEALHRDIGQVVQATGVDILITIGELAEGYAQGARHAKMDEQAIFTTANIDEALQVLIPYCAQAPVILVKASRFLELDRLVELLKQGYLPPEPALVDPESELPESEPELPEGELGLPESEPGQSKSESSAPDPKQPEEEPKQAKDESEVAVKAGMDEALADQDFESSRTKTGETAESNSVMAIKNGEEGDRK